MLLSFLGVEKFGWTVEKADESAGFSRYILGEARWTLIQSSGVLAQFEAKRHQIPESTNSQILKFLLPATILPPGEVAYVPG
jgi:hypothetical protein